MNRTDDHEEKEYAPRNPQELGEYYTRHISAMTAENLHDKSDIAAELAYRDKTIDELIQRNFGLCAVCHEAAMVIEDRAPEEKELVERLRDV